MEKIAKNYFFLFIIFFLTGCGTREYLGFEKKEIRLEGKRVSILKEGSEESLLSNKSEVEVLLEEPINILNWPQSFNSASHLSINSLSKSSLQRIKKVVSGKGENKKSKILSQPVIIENNLFFLDAGSNVISFDLSKRKLNWKKNIVLQNEKNHNIGGGIALYKDMVIVNSPYGQIISLDKNSGTEIWIKDIDAPLRSSPTIYDNKLFSLTVSNKLYALNIENGDLLWEHQGLFNNTTLMNSPKVAVDENIVIVPYSNGEFFALNLTNGKEIWRNSFIDLELKETTNAFTDIDAFPVIKKDMVIITSAIGKLIAVNKKTGNKFWARDIFSTQTPAVNGNSIFIINNNKELLCLNIIDGGVKWSLQIEEDLSKKNNYVWYTPVIINSKLLLVGGNKKSIIINSSEGIILTKKNLSNYPASSPLVVNGSPYILLRNGDIIQIE